MALHQRLINAELLECFSQNKNELILIFENLTIKAHLDPAFCCLAFPSDFQRARKNSVNLFEPLIGKKVAGVTQYLNERCFSIDFPSDNRLLFKMHGNRSNVILMKNGKAEQLFINRLAKDYELHIDQLDRRIDQSFEAFETADGDYKKLFPTFGKVVQQHIENEEYNDKSIQQQWKTIQQTLGLLEKGEFFIESVENHLRLNLLNRGDYLKKYTDPIEALNYFFNNYISQNTLTKEKSQVAQQLTLEVKRLKNYLSKSETKLREIENGIRYNQLADILMANLHQLKTGVNSVTLPNFYQNNKPIEIRMKRDISPQQNAENYYKKSKNQGLEISILKENIDNKIIQLTVAEDHLSTIDQLANLKDLRKYIKTEGLGKKEKEKQLSRPYFKFEFMGFDIYVGKSAKANDELLRDYSYKEDLWLHVKDVSGSHVVVKHKAGQEFSMAVIEKAAELAAYYSKRKNDSLCPVIYTPRKYVRKRKNDPPGAVVVEREQVILVEPKKF